MIARTEIIVMRCYNNRNLCNSKENANIGVNNDAIAAECRFSRRASILEHENVDVTWHVSRDAIFRVSFFRFAGAFCRFNIAACYRSRDY